MTEIEQADYITDEHLKWLDDLQESGTVNMYSASVPLLSKFRELSMDEAKIVVTYWMNTYGKEKR